MAFAQHILVPTDFSDGASLAVRAAKGLAKQFNARLTLVHVHDPEALRPPATIGYSPSKQQSLEDEVRAHLEQSLEDLARAELADLPDHQTQIVEDASAARAICDTAEALSADLIVLSTHGRTGLQHLLIGSVAEKVVRHAPCPVLTVRASE